MSDPAPTVPTASARRSRVWVGWAVVGIVALLIAASFLWRSDDAASAGKGGARPAPVATAPVVRETITERGRYPGELIADAADVGAFYGGRVEAVRVRVGDQVQADQVLAEIDPVDAREQRNKAAATARAADAEVERARVELKAAEVDLRRLEELLAKQVVSQQEVDTQRARTESLRVAVTSAAARGTEARAGVQVLDKRIVESVVRAPFAGRIAERYVDPGTIVAAGARLVRVVQVAPLRIRFQVPQADVAGLGAGTKLEAVTPSGKAPASVTGVAGEIDRDRRVATIEALIEPPPAGWLPGMFAEAVVDRRVIEGATVVPAAAVLSRLQPDGTVQSGVFQHVDGTARWLPVTVVARDGDRIAIDVPGPPLPPGAQVLTAGHVDLADGARVDARGGRGGAEGP
jgi:RND family efflux transporter MFP subunit